MMINNLPKYAEDMEYIVVRFCDGEIWFYGGYGHDGEKANDVAMEIGGFVIRNA